jgi:hypothetical protein
LQACGRVEVRLHTLLHSELDRDEWLVSNSGQFNPRDTGPGFRWLNQVCLRGGVGVDRSGRRQEGASTGVGVNRKRRLLHLSRIELNFRIVQACNTATPGSFTQKQACNTATPGSFTQKPACNTATPGSFAQKQACV